MIEDVYGRIDVFCEMSTILAQLGEKVRATKMANQALMEVSKIKDENRKIGALGVVAKIMVQIEEFDQALALANKIGDYSKAEVLVEIAKAIAQLGDKEKTIEIANRVIADADRIVILNSKVEVLGEMAKVMTSCGEKGKAAELVNRAMLIETIKYQFNKAKVQAEIANAMAQIGEKKIATEMANQVMREIDIIKNEYNNIKALGEMAKMMVKLGEFDRARAMANKIENWFFREKVLDEIKEAESLLVKKIRPAEKTNRIPIKANKIKILLGKTNESSEEANTITQQHELDQALAAAEMIQEKCDKAEALVDIAMAMVQIDEKAKAIDVANRALVEAKEITILYRKVDVLSEIARIMAQLGEFDQALAATEKIRDYSRKGIMGEIANMITEQKDFDRALMVANKIGDYSKAEVLVEMAKAIAQPGDKTKAIETANRVMAVAVTIKDEDHKSDVLGKVGQAASHIGQSEQTLFMMRNEFVVAQKAGLPEVLKKIGTWALFIAFMDQDGQTLRKIYETILEVDSWWNVEYLDGVYSSNLQ